MALWLLRAISLSPLGRVKVSRNTASVAGNPVASLTNPLLRYVGTLDNAGCDRSDSCSVLRRSGRNDRRDHPALRYDSFVIARIAWR